MLTRRNALAMIGALSAYTLWSMPSLSLTLPQVSPLNDAFIPDRELTLSLSDDLRGQAWCYAGQHYVETRDTIALDENEQLRLRIVNDTSSEQSLLFDSLPINLASGETVTLDLNIDSLRSRSLRNDATGVNRTIYVRPAHQSHSFVGLN